MKTRSVIFTCFLFLITKHTYAQLFLPANDSKIHLNISGGYTQSEIEGSFVDYQLSHYLGGRRPELHGKKGIEAEIGLNVKIYKFLSAKAGIGYNEQGGEIKYNNLVYPVDVKSRYIHVPLSLCLDLVKIKNLTLGAEGGLQFNQEISSDQDFKKGTIIKNWSATFIPAYTYRLVLGYHVNSRLGITGSYKYLGSLKPFYEQEYFTWRISMKTVAESYSLGVSVSLK